MIDVRGGRMRPIAKILSVCVFTFVNTSCSVNILENFADKTSNEALLVDAKMLINKSDYTGALAKIDKMTGTYPVRRDVLTVKASAYGGLCGLRFLDFVEALGNMGSTRLFPFLMSSFRSGATVDTMDYCLQAEDTVESIGAVGERTVDENLLLALISFAKIGNTLSFYGDVDQDGAVTTSYNTCTVGGSRTAGGGISDADARQIGSGITIALESIAAISGSVQLGSGSMTDIDNVCQSLAALPLPGYNFCSITNPADFTADHLKGIRSMLKEDQSLGLGANCSGDITACNCP